MPDGFGNSRAIALAVRRAQRLLRPPPALLPSEWAEANVRIPQGNAIPGLIRFDNAPYQREPMDMAVNPDCHQITLMWGAQTGKTQVVLCMQAYNIAQRPASQIMMQPSQGDLTTWLETKFAPMVDANDTLQNLIAKPRGRDGVNNQRMKSYPGGWMMFAWSGSPKTMRGRSAPKIYADEVDGYEVTDEGHPVNLLHQRAATFGDEALLVETSTPTIRDASRIETSFESGDQRYFYVRCPHCGHDQRLVWANVHWDRTPDGEHLPETACYVCEGCGATWDDGERMAAIRDAETSGAGWRATKPFRGHASYHLSELYSCFRRLRDIVRSFLDKKADNDLQTFVNVSLAETWEEQGEQADHADIAQRAETFRAQVPEGGIVLTAGVDMQPDRLEVEVVAWGLGEESWSVDYQVLWGDTLRPDVWDDLDDLLDDTYQHESGAQMTIRSAGLDTGGTGGNTQAAYDYVRKRVGRRVFALKGMGGWGRPIVSAPSRKKSGRDRRKVDLFMVGVDEAKLIVMRRLAIADPGPGFCHVPIDREAEWYRQLTAEKLLTKYVKGYAKREWRKTRERNEALDCRVYAYAALKVSSPNLRQRQRRLEASESKPKDQAETVPEAIKPARRKTAKKPARKRRGSFVGNRNGSWL